MGYINDKVLRSPSRGSTQNRSPLIFSHRRVMDVQDDTKVTERAILTKFEKREWFLENLRLLLLLDLNQDPSDEDSRSEWLRLHRMEGTVSHRTCVGTGLTLIVSPPLLCIDKKLPRATLFAGSVS